MTRTVNVHEAKTQLSRLLQAVERGEDIVIARAGKPVARLVAAGSARIRTPGSLRNQLWIADDFDDTPAEIAGAFVADDDPTRP
ncbi:type II toxin-antitoxin system Phd/YefM family antitoxin [Nakamurella endophytica]|uniref:Antitoxin n=1 Tax=Nakamurella endophytica TaxID=1748367 RepID=A0A917SP71_9ACTN|nr:type II toxin-antitoxin system prevent-host-death family antitoxin [Nakamurella endophytica]GGL89497.1 antitoxin [Nakamurella endophytica]